MAGFLAMLQEQPANPATAFSSLDEQRGGPQRGDLPALSQEADLIIQTVHGSKGLEYDDVILPLLRNKGKGIRKGRMLTNPGTLLPMLAWKLGMEPGEKYQMISSLTESQQRRDDLNLFYVALTRAKRRLCLLVQAPLAEKPNEGGKERENAHSSWAQLGEELYGSHSGLQELVDPPNISVPTRRELPIPERASAPLSPSASPAPDVQRFGEGHADNLHARQEGEEMHAYLQDLLVRWEDAEALARVLHSPPSIPNAKENAMRFLDAFEARGWRHLRRRTEMDLRGASQSGGKGRADLVVWDKECTHIIDFKHVHKLDRESRDAYTQQLARYAAAVRKQTASQGSAIRGWLVLLKSGEWVEMVVPHSGE
jgi:ATP-dependent exoDNAse (exonuclease V) beta subunit